MRMVQEGQGAEHGPLTHTHSTVEGFYGLGQEQHHKKTFTFEADHPEIFDTLDLKEAKALLEELA